MWNKRKEDEYPPKPAVPPAPATPVKENAPMSTTVHRPDAGEPRGSAVIGKSVSIKGEIHSREDLTIDGEVEGTVELHDNRLTVGPNGKVNASVKAREIIVLGSILGNVEVTDKIDIRKDAKLVGDIRTARIVIEDGAYFKGSTDIVRPDVKPETKPDIKPQTGGAPTPATAAPHAAGVTK
jgi:cytoskeletal protein CcmA (bactofilin family)